MKKMKRCFHLARLGSVGAGLYKREGAVLSKDDKIIGEGFRSDSNDTSAIINAFNSVHKDNHRLLHGASLFVVTEPCEDNNELSTALSLILKYGIKKVIISYFDAFDTVATQFKSALKNAGVELITGILEGEGRELNKFYHVYQQKKKPYIIFKYAQSKDHKIGKANEQIWLTTSRTKRLVHRWRSECAAIMVGTNTAITDDPRLTNRLYFGENPLRIVLDRRARIPKTTQLYQTPVNTWVVSEEVAPKNLPQHIKWLPLKFDEELLLKLLEELYNASINSLLVEGGAGLLNSFIEQNLWDEARVFQTQKVLGTGIPAPVLDKPISETYCLGKDELLIYYN